MKNVTIKNSCAEVCDLLPEWEACECGPNGFEGYDKTDGPFSYCLNGISMVATSLTDDKNCDDPYTGSQKVVPTWSVITLTQWMATKQDVLRDCDNALLPANTKIVSCANLETSIATRQGQLKNCAGQDHATGDSVPSCDEMNAADTALQNQIATKQGQLKGCDGNDLAAGTEIASCADLSTAVANIPQPKKCGGDDIDGELVQCDQFGDLFKANLEDDCLTISGAADACNPLSPVGLSIGPDGCGKFVTISASDLEVTTGSYGAHGGGNLSRPFPADRFSTVPYTFPELRDDLSAGTVDETRLAENFLFCHTFDIECEAVYNIFSEATIQNTQNTEVTGKSRMVYSLDGDLIANAATGVLRPTKNFLSTEAQFTEEVYEKTLTVGSHTICMYMVRSEDDPAWPFAQILPSGSPLFTITKKLS